AKAAAWSREHSQVAGVVERLSGRREGAETIGLGDPDPLEPVLCLRRTTVIRGSPVGKNGRETRATGIPLAGTTREHGSVPVPVEAVRARGVARRHPVFLVLDVQRMATDPGVPAAVSTLDDRILEADGLVARKDRANVRIR